MKTNLLLSVMVLSFAASALAETPETNLALNKNAYASSTFSANPEFPPKKANDGLTDPEPYDSNWICDFDKDAGAWWEVDLGVECQLTEVKVKFRKNAEGNFSLVPITITIQTGNDKPAQTPEAGNDKPVRTSVVVKSKAVPENYKSYEDKFFSYPLPANTKGRFVRLLFEDGGVKSKSAGNPNLLGLVEVEVWGTK